jgi:hypothetical protein
LLSDPCHAILGAIIDERRNEERWSTARSRSTPVLVVRGEA